MTRHFLHIFVFTLIEFVLFLNLYQFSHATTPFFSNSHGNIENTYFGFQSLLNWFTDLSLNPYIETATKFLDEGVKVIKMWSLDLLVDSLDKLFKVTTTSTDFNFWDIIVGILELIINLFVGSIALPIAILYSIVVVFLSVTLYIWNILQSFSLLFNGYYNTPRPDIDVFISELFGVI